MYWSDEGYLLSKTNFDENSIIVEGFTLNHGKCTGIIYGGSSRKQKRNFQLCNKILFNWISKGENKSGYFSTELIKPISPFFFDDKKRSACIVSAASILKILLPERQINEKIYYSFENLLLELKSKDWINLYIKWELVLIKELGFETNIKMNFNNDPRKALSFNRNLLMENFIIPNRLKLPVFRNILEKYFL
jgi:DNA repair protein RecO (recombination protein O)|tara:strand:+ start:360 stop:935 length:576 start_codon:yes stop_codon:yes gene_type:complete